MRPLLLPLAALCAAALVGSVAADDEVYEIKNARFPAKDRPVTVNDKAVYTTAVKVTDEKGNVISDKKEKEKATYRSYVEKTLDVSRDERTRFSRTYTKAKDVEGDESEKKPYQGRTIVYEGSEGKWKLRAEGKPELRPGDLKELTEQANKKRALSEKALYPSKAVKVGGTWQLPAREVAEFFAGLNMVEKSIKGEGKLVKVYEKGKRKWGTLELTIDFEAPLGDVKGGKGKIKGKIEQPIDGSSSAAKANIELTLSASKEVEQNCKKYEVKVTVKVVITSEHDDTK